MSDTKKDPTLGERVHQHLLSVGVETPLNPNCKESSAAGKRHVIEESIRVIMHTLGLDLQDDSLQDTPRRVAKMYVDEIFSGLDYANFPKCTTVDNKMRYDEMVVVRNINVSSACEHHLVQIWGNAAVAYIPKGKVLGLSKINRVVEFFAKRPQIQERLTEQVYHALSYLLETPDVAVIIDAEHYCVKARGVRDISSSTITSKVGGVFKDQPVKAEFLALVNSK